MVLYSLDISDLGSGNTSMKVVYEAGAVAALCWLGSKLVLADEDNCCVVVKQFSRYTDADEKVGSLVARPTAVTATMLADANGERVPFVAVALENGLLQMAPL